MVKLVVLYKKPADPEAFDEHYQQVHLPLAAKMPGLIKTEISRIQGSPAGESPYHLMAEMYFQDRDTLDRSMASDEGKAAARDLMHFAGPLVTMMIAKVD